MMIRMAVQFVKRREADSNLDLGVGNSNVHNFSQECNVWQYVSVYYCCQAAFCIYLLPLSTTSSLLLAYSQII